MLDNNNLHNVDGQFYKVINLNATPLDYKESTHLGVVKFGKDNNYPQYLLDLLNKSTSHSAIVKNKAAMIGGGGWDTSSLTDPAKIFLQNKGGGKGKSADEIVKMNAEDLETYNAFALKVIPSRDRTTIGGIEYVDPYKLRIEETNPDFPDVENYFIGDDWSKYRVNKIWYQGFNPDTFLKSGAQILYVRGSKPQGLNKYTLPDYYSAINSILAEYEISAYHLNNIQNSFSPNIVINHRTGQPTPEQFEMYIRQMNRDYTGATGNKILHMFSDKDNNAVVTPIPSGDSDGAYKDLSKNIQDNIFVGHQVNNPALMGVRVPGELGNTNDLTKDLARFQEQQISPRQKIIEDAYTKILSAKGINDKLKLQRFTIDVKVDISVGDLLSILTSACPDEQKIQIMVAIGYSEKEATKLVKSGQKPPQNDPTQNG
ncbi:MAG: hypothetical protein BGO69_15895 [Bacteroidetes bacterium 46-16]|nr:MAG: hypothetical protein BGO69_15895 [Bacteroidetes bacterium 46-16]